MFSHPSLYDNNDRIPVTNGPVRVVTPPLVSAIALPIAPNQRVFEFLVPFPMHMVDQQDWPPIEVPFNDSRLRLLKPFTALGTFDAEGRLGNESAESYCTVFRAICAQDTSPDSIAAIWNLLENMLLWIRVRARHYWLLHGSTGYGASSRGSIMDRGRQQNFVLASANMLVRPFSRTMWLSLASDLLSGSLPPLSESLFCDGLLSAVAHDEMKALLELGVACEVEITQLLEAAVAISPLTPDKQRYATKGGAWDRFAVKLRDWPSRLGLDDAISHQASDIPANWVSLLEELYNMRNGVVHSGKKKAGGSSVQAYVFAANALFQYSHIQRRRLGLLRYDFEAVDDPSRQIVAYTDAVLHFLAG